MERETAERRGRSTAAAPQLMLEIKRTTSVEVEGGQPGETRVYEAGRRYYVRVPLARQLVRSGAAVLFEPVQAVGMSPGEVEAFEQLGAKHDDEDTPASEQATASHEVAITHAKEG